MSSFAVVLDACVLIPASLFPPIFKSINKQCATFNQSVTSGISAKTSSDVRNRGYTNKVRLRGLLIFDTPREDSNGDSCINTS